MRLWFAHLITCSNAVQRRRDRSSPQGLAGGVRLGRERVILREGNALLHVGPQPNYIGDDLDAIADQLIAR
jgi:hypothetical protein